MEVQGKAVHLPVLLAVLPHTLVGGAVGGDQRTLAMLLVVLPVTLVLRVVGVDVHTVALVRTQSEVIRANMLKDSPCLLHGTMATHWVAAEERRDYGTGLGAAGQGVG